MLDAGLFDFDGTLVDTTELIYQSMRHATGEVFGCELPHEVLMANVGQPLPRQMEVLVEGYAGDRGGSTDPARLANELLESYRLHNERNHEDLIREFPGIEETLARLREAGIKVAVVTSKRRSSVELAVQTFPGLGEVADHFVTMEDTDEHKPRPAPLLKGLELLGASRESAAYVGDSPHDVEAARAAGIPSVALSWGAFPESVLREAEPDYVVPDLDSAVDVLLQMAGDR